MFAGVTLQTTPTTEHPFIGGGQSFAGGREDSFLLFGLLAVAVLGKAQSLLTPQMPQRPSRCAPVLPVAPLQVGDMAIGSREMSEELINTREPTELPNEFASRRSWPTWCGKP